MSLGAVLQVTFSQFADYLGQFDQLHVLGPGYFAGRIRGQWRVYQVTDLPTEINSVQQRMTLLGPTGSAVSVATGFPGSLTPKLAVALQSNQTIGLTGGAAGKAQVSVTNVATQLLNATGPNNMVIRNTDGANSVFLGDSNVTTALGYELKAGEILNLSYPVTPSGIYGITTAAAVNVDVLLA